MNQAVVYLESETLACLGLEARAFSALAGGIDGVARVQVVGPGTGPMEPFGPADRMVWVGGGPTPFTDQDQRASAAVVDLRALTPWMGPDVEASALTLIRAALAEADLDRPREWTRLEPIPLAVVVGEGTGAESVVRALEAAGIPVETVPEQGLVRIEGFVGRFTLVFEDNRTLPAGVVLLCGREDRTPAFIIPGMNVQPLSAFTAERAEASANTPNPPARVAFVASDRGATSTVAMRRMLESALWVRMELGGDSFLLAPQIKVAEPGLERLYTRARDAGVVFIRTRPGEPVAELGPEGRPILRVRDLVARADLTITPDRVVVEDALAASPAQSDLARGLGLGVGADGFAGPDNVLMGLAGTLRRGIMALGPARGTDNQVLLAAEIAAATAETAALLRSDPVETNRLTVNEEECAHCLSCVRVCPVGAIQFTNRPWFHPAACAACGMCMARCPAKAITLASDADERARRRMDILLGRPRTEASTVRLVLFGCRRSAIEALGTARPPERPVDLAVMGLPCGGRLDDGLVLRSFVKGADGVLVAACHEGNCRTGEGSPESLRRVGRIQSIMADVGFDPRRLERITLAPNQGSALTGRIETFAARIQDLGPVRKGDA